MRTINKRNKGAALRTVEQPKEQSKLHIRKRLIIGQPPPPPIDQGSTKNAHNIIDKINEYISNNSNQISRNANIRYPMSP